MTEKRYILETPADLSAAAVVAAIHAVADATAVIGFFSAIISAGLTLVALIFRVAHIIRRVKAGKLSADKAAEEVEKLKGDLKK